MEALFSEALRLLERGENLLLATIVRAWGSTPQKAGAKYLVRQDGSTMGTLGGGCIEAEVWGEARSALKEEESQLREFELNEGLDEGDGLVCGGRVKILLDVLGEEFLPLAREMARLDEAGQGVALATCLSPELGRKLLVTADGGYWGSWGMPSLEAQARQRALGLLSQKGEAEWLEVEAGEFWVEVFSPPPLLVIAGAGHIAQALCPLARMLGFRVYVVDERSELANPQVFPQADAIVVGDFASTIAGLPISEDTSILVATPGHKQDEVALAAAVATRAGYVGLVGSRRKALLILQSLAEKGCSQERLAQLRTPVGLDIGARTPQEIALSILAEVLMFRRGGQGGPMKLSTEQLSHLRAWSRLSF